MRDTSGRCNAGPRLGMSPLASSVRVSGIRHQGTLVSAIRIAAQAAPASVA